MPRLPIPGKDGLIWGDLLNDFLLVSHNPDGTLILAPNLESKYEMPAGGIPRTHLSSDVQASLSKVDDVMTTMSVPVITKNDVGLSDVTNDAQLPLTGGTLTGDLCIKDGHTMRAYHTDNIKYIELKTDAYWSRITAGGTSGFVLAGQSVQMDASQVVTNASIIRPTANTITNIGTATLYYKSVFAQRHYFNAGAYLDGTTADVISISDGASLAFGTNTGTKLATSAAQKLGFFGTVPITQPVGGNYTASPSYGLNEQHMMNTMWTALRNLGLLS